MGLDVSYRTCASQSKALMALLVGQSNSRIWAVLHVRAGDRSAARAAAQLHPERDLAAEDLEHVAHAVLAPCGQAPENRAPDQRSPCSERECLQHIGAA